MSAGLWRSDTFGRKNPQDKNVGGSMDKKKLAEVFAVCVLMLVLAGYVEQSEQVIRDGNKITRPEAGSGTNDVELVLDAGDVLEGYDYTLSVPAVLVTEAEAAEYLAQAKEEIDQTFFADGEDADCVTQTVKMKTSYCSSNVEAEWSLDSYRVVDMDGNICADDLGEEGEIVQADASLTCGEYSEEYVFAFHVYQEVPTAEEQLLKDIGESLSQEEEQEGETLLTLPQEAAGVTLKWSEKKQYLVWKVLFFEIVVIILMRFTMAERKKNERKSQQDQMQLDYADVVCKLLILMGSGMTLKQAWERIAAQYDDKRQKNQIERHYIYEEMLLTCNAIHDGESESAAYRKFADRTDMGSYQRLVRILIQNMKTGSKGLCQLLEQESQTALEERKALARKLGEEAGTKMLLPLMMMLGIVIAIIMVPAMLSFQV
jgi:hypothetical protein